MILSSWRNMIEQLLFALGLLALLYAAMLSSGLVNRKDVRLSPSLERKRILVATHPNPIPRAPI